MCGQTAAYTLARGSRIKCTATVSWSGLMVDNMKAILSTMSRRDKEPSSGLMDASTQASGLMVNSTALEY